MVAAILRDLQVHVSAEINLWRPCLPDEFDFYDTSDLHCWITKSGYNSAVGILSEPR